MTVVASAASRARYCGTVTPPRSCSPRNVFKVIGEASFPARMSCDATSKIRRCKSSEKCSDLRKSEIRSKASLLTRIAPSRACSASTLCGARRNVGSGLAPPARRVLAGRLSIAGMGLLDRRRFARQVPNQFKTCPLVPRRRGKKEGIFGRAESAHAIHTSGTICKKMAGQGALLDSLKTFESGPRDFLSDFGAQSDKNVSRETFWYDWRSKGSYTRKALKLS